MKHFLNNYLEFLSPFIVLFSLLLCYRNWYHLKEIRILFIYFFIFTIIIGRTTWLARFTIINTDWYSLYEFFSIILLPSFFYSIITSSKLRRQILWVSIFIVPLYILLFFIWNDHIIFFSPGFALGGILIVYCANIYLIDFFFHNNEKNITPVFWIVCALMLYHVSSVLIHGSHKYLSKLIIAKQQSHQLLKLSTLWGIQNVMLFFSCTLIAVFIFRFKRLNSLS